MLIPCLHLRSPRFLFLFLSAPLEELLMVLTLVVYCQPDAVVYWKDGTSRSKLISYMITQSTNVEFSISCNYIETVSTDVRTAFRAPNGFNGFAQCALLSALLCSSTT